MTRSIAVLGAIVYDEIVTHDKRRIESFGGIIYNLAALSSLVSDEAVILPHSNVGADRWDDVIRLIDDMPGVSKTGLRMWDGKLTHARLVYTDANHRDEFVLNMMRPFTIEELRTAMNADGVIVNFVNGTEIDLPTMKEFRRASSGVFYLDMHNIMVRFGENGDKTVIDFNDWPEWVAQYDIVQMNEFEASSVIGRELDTVSDFISAAHRVLEAGPVAVLVTMGPRGVVVAHRKDGDAYGAHIPAGKVGNFVDATGCGDAFSTGTLWNYLQTGDVLVSAMAGALVGAINTEVRGIGKLDRARNAADRIEEVDAPLAAKVRSGWPGERLGTM